VECPAVAHHFAVEAVDLALARQRHQFHRALLARLEAHGRAGGDVQAHAVGAPALEGQRRIDFKKWKCEPTWMGRSPRLATTTVAVARPAFSDLALFHQYSPGS
jgi:hypothetical protein